MKAIDVLLGVMRRQRETAGTDLADSAAPLEARLKWARENDRASYDYFIKYGVFPRKPRRVIKPDGPGALPHGARRAGSLARRCGCSSRRSVVAGRSGCTTCARWPEWMIFSASSARS